MSAAPLDTVATQYPQLANAVRLVEWHARQLQDAARATVAGMSGGEDYYLQAVDELERAIANALAVAALARKQAEHISAIEAGE